MLGKKTGYTFLLTVLCMGTIFAQSTQPVVEAKLTPDSIVIGDQFRLDVTVEKDIVQVLDFPVFNNNKLGDKIEILSESTIDTLSREGRKVKLQKSYLLTIFDEGIYSLGKFPMLYADKNIVDTLWSRDSLMLHVSTFDIDTTKQTIYDIKPQMKTPLKIGEVSGYVLWGLLALAVIALLVWYIIRRRANRPILGRKESILPPHVVAIIALEELKNQKLWQSSKHKLYYTKLTDIIREYIEGRYSIGAMEMTSDEILDAIKDANLSAKCFEELKALLKASDLVKFAKYTPETEENESAFVNAYYFVEDSKPSLVEEPKESE